MRIWQSWGENEHNSIASWGKNEHNSIAYFDHLIQFEALKCKAFVKGGAHTLCIAVSGIHVCMYCATAPPLMEALHYNALNVIGDQNMQLNGVCFPGTVTNLFIIVNSKPT